MNTRTRVVGVMGAVAAAGLLVTILAAGEIRRPGSSSASELGAPSGAVKVREPAVAGAFYPADAAELRRQVKGFLAAAPVRAHKDEHVIAVIAPHAGYVYSGATAGRAFAYVAGAAPKRVIVIGLSHRGGPAPVWVDDVRAYGTPLGEILVDRGAVARLVAAGIPAVAHAADSEHSIEVELPFLKEALAPGWAFVPVLVGAASAKDCERAAAAIKTVLDDDTIVVISSDFTHYGENYGYVPFAGTGEEIRRKLTELDDGAAKLITAKDAAGFDAYVERTGATICGRYPIITLLDLLPEWATGSEAGYAMSADTSRDYSLTVGYEGIVFAVTGRDKDLWKSSGQGETTMPASKTLTDSEKKTLLAIARASLEAAVGEGKRLDASQFHLTDAIKENRGAFVTLEENGELRGCIGYIEAMKPLWQTVMENAVNAAQRDPRFPPVEASELGKIRIEISAMSPLEKITDVSKIEVGKHGILMTRGYYSGVLLPQVATEEGWDREEFLAKTCWKAGLPLDAWKDPKTTIQIFSAEVFHEEEPKK